MLFGTDVGYMADYDPAPAKRLTKAPGAGLVAVGSPGDVAVLDADPASDVRALAKVRYTIRAGRVIYDRDAP